MNFNDPSRLPLDEEIPDITNKVDVDTDFNKKRNGGMSDVYPGRYKTDTGEIEVAVKLLRSLSDDPQGEKIPLRKNREANAWHKATHPNILIFLGVVFKGNTVGFVSPFMKNHDAFSYVKQRNEVQQKGQIVLGIVKGLQYMHEKNVVHGDLKLHNIMFDHDGTPKICDFGLSRIIDRPGYTTATHNRTWSYLAPEIIEKEWQGKVPSKEDRWTTKETDIYSLSITAAEVFMQAPYHINLTKVYDTVVTLNVRPEKSVINSEKYFPLLEACWQKEPEKRLRIDQVLEWLEVINNDLRNGASSNGSS